MMNIRTHSPSFFRTLLIALTALTTAACGSTTEPDYPADQGVFEIEVSGETFVVEVEGEANVAAFEARRANGTEGAINGNLRPQDGGVNEGWSWHLDPETVEAVDVTIELCDGRPSMVEADLDYWINVVGRFCPWGATVTRRIS